MYQYFCLWANVLFGIRFEFAYDCAHLLVSHDLCTFDCFLFPLCICMCLCVFVCMCVLYTFVFISMHLHLFISVCAYLCLFACI